MAYTRRNTTDGVTVMNKDLYDNLQDGIEERGVTLEMFGGKAGDSDFDNSPALIQAVKYATSNKTNIILTGRSYYFYTPIVIESLYQFSIIGVGNADLIYKGEKGSWFLTIDHINNVTFKDFKVILSSDNYGINLRGNSESSSYKFRLINLDFQNGVIPLKFVRGGYLYIIGCSFFCSEATGSEVTRILFTNNSKSKYATEYTYIYSCNFEGMGGNNIKVGGNAITYESGQLHYVFNCDICNWCGDEELLTGKGVNIQPNDYVKDIYIIQNSFMRTLLPLYIDSNNGTVHRVFFNENFHVGGNDYISYYTKGSLVTVVGTREVRYLSIERNNNSFSNYLFETPYKLGKAYQVVISEYSTVYPNIQAEQVFVYHNLFLDIIKKYSVVNPQITGSNESLGITVADNSLVLNATSCPFFFFLNIANVKIVSIVGGNVGDEISVTALSTLTLIPSGNFLCNLKTSKEIQVGETVTFKKVNSATWITL